MFNHVDQLAWPTEKLEARFTELQKHTEIVPLSQERLAQVQHEMACIAFEGIMRQSEAGKRQDEIELLEELYGGQMLLPIYPKVKPNSDRWK